MLHVTNGESVSLRQAGLPGDVIYWKDVLHEGPAPAGLALEEMSRVRAQFIAGCGWGEFAAVWEDFRRRDEILAGFRAHEEVVLWFEHDLYDQLHLIQVLDWFSAQNLGTTRLSFVLSGEYLGPMSTAQLVLLFPLRQGATAAQLRLGSAAWRAFCAPQPWGLERLLREDTSALPFLEGALRRHLEQFPDARNGLSRSERQVLEILAEGPKKFGDAFRADQAREERIFLGDTVFALYLKRLSGCPQPLVEQSGSALRITATGSAVLRGAEDHVRLNGIDRWLGGVHLQGAEAMWRWNGERIEGPS